jgi:hypothetical protein
VRVRRFDATAGQGSLTALEAVPAATSSSSGSRHERSIDQPSAPRGPAPSSARRCRC